MGKCYDYQSNSPITVMAFTCQHCDEEPESVTRTGNKRYMCGACSKVVKFDDLNPHLDDLEVVDKRGGGSDSKSNSANSSNSNNDSSNNSNENVSQDSQGSQEAAPEITSNTGKSNRDIIRERGREGLKEIKEDKLKQWLATTDGVGSKTENRILMVFRNEEMYSEEPNTLYNLLDDELNASPSYINTIVNSVFSPEYEHEDLLRNQGYTPFFASGGQGGGGMGAQSMGPGNNRNNGYNSQQQGGGGMGGQQQGNQGGQQQTGGDLTREDLMTAMQASQEQSEGGSRRRGPGTEAIDQATEEAIKNMANNMGGFFGTMQKVAEEALVSYFQQNPEKLVENMTLLNTFMESGNGQNQENQPSEQDQKIDNAIQQATAGGGSSQPQQQESQSSQPFRDSEQVGNERDTTAQTGSDDSGGFEMDTDVMEGRGPGPEPEPDAGVDSENPMAAEPDDYDWSNNSDNDSSSGELDQEPTDEVGPEEERSEEGSAGDDDGEDEWDELFGDLEE